MFSENGRTCRRRQPCRRAPRPFPLRFQRRQMVFHGHQHDVRILKAQVAFVVGGIKRALTFGVGVERVVSVRMLVGGYRAGVPLPAHRQGIDDGDAPGTVAFRVSGDVQHEPAMFEGGVMRHVRLLGKPREQAGLGLGPFVEESVPGLAAAAAYIDAGEFGDEGVAERRVFRRHAKSETGLAVGVAGGVIALLIGVCLRFAGRARTGHVHELEADVDDVVTRRIDAGGFDVDAHHRVHVAAGQIGVAPVGLGMVAGSVARRGGTTRRSRAGEIGAGHRRIARTLLEALGLTSFGACVKNRRRTVLDIVQGDCCGELDIAVFGSSVSGRCVTGFTAQIQHALVIVRWAAAGVRPEHGNGSPPPPFATDHP